MTPVYIRKKSVAVHIVTHDDLHYIVRLGHFCGLYDVLSFYYLLLDIHIEEIQGQNISTAIIVQIESCSPVILHLLNKGLLPVTVVTLSYVSLDIYSHGQSETLTIRQFVVITGTLRFRIQFTFQRSHKASGIRSFA